MAVLVLVTALWFVLVTEAVMMATLLAILLAGATLATLTMTGARDPLLSLSWVCSGVAKEVTLEMMGKGEDWRKFGWTDTTGLKNCTGMNITGLTVVNTGLTVVPGKGGMTDI